ncbi:MAG: MFS transporter, partial [Minwuiales bacterium]|nr:MFS transporter [Minwuiales bacterium]
GQLLLNVADPGGFLLFIAVSVLVSLALVPILLTVAPAPSFDEPSHVGLLDLYRISPLGVVGAFAIGTAHGSVFGMGAVYAERAGLNVAEISVFMALYLVGGMVLQWPIGRLSDRFDRRLVLTAVTLVAAAAAIVAVVAPGLHHIALFAVIGLFGGLSLPMYSLCLAHTNDYLEPRQMVAASSSLVMLTGIGACLGPFSVAMIMSLIGAEGFFWWVGGIHAGIGVFAIWRMSRRPSLPAEEQGPFVAVPPRASPLAAAVTPKKVRDQLDRDLARLSGR